MNLFKNSKFKIILFIYSSSILYYNIYFVYESTFSRFWQFLSGILSNSYYVGTKNKKILLLISFSILLFPLRLNRNIFSFLIVVCCSLLISSISDFNFLQFRKLRRVINVFVFLGDISYVLYLVHWPIISYMRFKFLKNSSESIGKYFNLNHMVTESFRHSLWSYW